MLQWKKTKSSSDSPTFKLKMSYCMNRYLLTIILSSMIFSGCAGNPASDAALRLSLIHI